MMFGDQCAAFGKLEQAKDGAVIAWHPLVDHLIDVAACFERLCQCRSIRRALEQAAGRALTPRDLARLTVLVFLHDLGKANSGFQSRRWPAGKAPKGWLPSVPPIGHGPQALDLFRDEPFLAPLLNGLPLEAIES